MVRRGRGGVLFLALGLGLLTAHARASETALVDLAPFAGKSVAAIDVVGQETTRERVIRREIQTAVGEPLSLETVEADVVRLDNLSIFAEIRVEAASAGEGVRLVYHFKEMPAWIPWVGFSYTEQDGFSGGPKLSALNLKGQAIALTGRSLSRVFG